MASGEWWTTSGGGGGVVERLIVVGIGLVVIMVVGRVAYSYLGATGCVVLAGAIAVGVAYRLAGTFGVVALAAGGGLVATYVAAGLAAFLTVLAFIGVVEGGAAVSATLDWLEADVELVTKRQVWLYAHWTMLRRCTQRVVWWWGLTGALIILGRRQVETPAAAEEPASLALVVDMRDRREERGAA